MQDPADLDEPFLNPDFAELLVKSKETARSCGSRRTLS